MLASAFARLSLAARPAASFVSHRTLFATPRFAFPARAAQTTANEPTRASRATPVKRGRPPKRHTAKKPKQRVRIPKELRPPKRAPGPYFLFYAQFVKSQPKVATLQEYQELSKRAGQIWRDYSMAEKQPFYDENEERKVQAKHDREEFFRKTSLSELKQLNAIRKAQGKPKFHSKKKATLPMTPFILFSSEFRNSPEAQTIINGMSPEKRYVVRAVVAAADRWKSMSQEEKAPYFEKYKKAKEQLNAEHA